MGVKRLPDKYSDFHIILSIKNLFLDQKQRPKQSFNMNNNILGSFLYGMGLVLTEDQIIVAEEDW